MLGAIVTVVFLALLWAVVLVLKLPLWIAIAVTAALALLWAALLVWRRVRARRAAGEIEKALEAQAHAQAGSVRPDQLAEAEAMREEFQKAIHALKSSKLARGGRDALAVLPWYVIVGPPGAGKSTALRASGLRFPYQSKRGSVRGVGGTRNCDWWLTNEAVLLDTAGRYTTEEDDRDEWFGFLDMLKKARPRRPLNGLLVAVSVAEVGGETEEGASELGRRVRERVDEVMSRLSVVLPVYVLFTKCDLLPGFVETFADLRKTERGQIWGFTVPAAEGGERRALFDEHLDELVGALEERAMRRLAEERQLAARERIYGFPQQLEAVRPQLAAFVESLFAENVYQDAPIMRGAYFTSGTQEGRTIDRVMASMAEAFGVRPQVSAPEPVLDAKSYFLRDVFSRVVFPDQDLAIRNARATRRDAVRRWVALGAAAAAAAAVLFFPLRAFLLGRELVASTGQIVDAVAGKLTGAERGAPPLGELEPLRERLALLVRYAEEGPPLSMRFGMYRGDALAPHVRRFYAASVRRLVLDPVFRQDVQDLDAFVRRLEASDATPTQGEHARYYDALKLHLLLTAPRGLGEPKVGDAERAWIAKRVADRWAGRWTAASGPAAAELIAANAELYGKLLADDAALALPRYEDLVKRVRRVLGRVRTTDLALERLAAEVEGKGYDLNLAAVLSGPVPSLRATARVRGAFTRRAFEEVLKARLDNPAGILEPWVLAGDVEADARQAEESERLRSRYFEAYIEEWRRFLDSLSVEAGGGSQQALGMLQDLTRGEPPPYGRLMRAVGHNTRLGGLAGELAKAGEGVVQKIRRTLGADGERAPDAQRIASAERVLGPRDVEKAFAGFVEFGFGPEATVVAAAGSAPPPRSMALDVYQEQLAFVRDALQTAVESADPGPLLSRIQTARTRVRALIDTQEVGWRPRLESLLWPPIEAASRTSAREAAAGAASKWCAAVALPFKRTLAGRYPFNRDGDDAALADVAEFFRPTGAVWAFFNESLRAEVQRSGDGFAFARQLGGASGFRPDLLVFLRKAQDLTTVLFPSGSAEPQVPFSVRIRPTPRIAAVFLEVDGQRIEYRNGPEEWHKLVWPGQGKMSGASLKVRGADGREETLQQEGEWGLFRLLEAGRLKGEPSFRAFTMTWSLPALGATIAVDFQAARSETPFFGVHKGAAKARLLEPFRAGVSAPLAIGKGGAGCL